MPRPRRSDLALIGLSLLVGGLSLSWPFGRDQGLYAYVAREWVHHGRIPYRDVLDHKTPGIYLVHALTTIAFGDRAWGIRVADLVCILVTGFLCARLATPARERIPNGLVGIGCLASSIFYFGFLNYWDSAQSEIWYAMLGLACVASALHIPRMAHAALACGFAAGAALVMKPPAITFVALAVALLLNRARNEIASAHHGSTIAYARVIAWCAVGGIVAIAPLLAYFASKGALEAMKDIVVGANSYYVTHERGSTDLGDVFDKTQDYLGVYNPFSSIGLLGTLVIVVSAARTGNTRWLLRHALALSLTFAAFVSTAMQQKFYLLHWGVMVGPAALVFTAFGADLIEWAKAHRDDEATGWRSFWPTTEGRAIAFGSVLLIVLFVGSGPRFRHYWDDNRNTLGFWRGEKTRAQFVQGFAFPEIDFSCAESEWVGEWLREHSSPDDLVAVRGFEPQIYAVANRRMEGRFFWTLFLTAPSRAYRRPEWLAEDEEALRAHPPRFVVAMSREHVGPDAPETFQARGYQARASTPLFTIMER